jgi:hypothetical protein
MIRREGDFEEWELAESAFRFIPLYLREKDDQIFYIPYLDVPSGEKKHIKYAFEPAIGWVYVDNSQ